MQFIETPIMGLYLIQLNKIQDERGFFARTFCKEQFSKIGFNKEFVQFNHSFNKIKGTIRGMHFQQQPFSETKLIRCVEGCVYDVAVDLRKDSASYMQSFGVELSSDNMICILIPEGFAHGFQTLQDNTALIYHHTNYYKPNTEGGIRFDDKILNIQWKLPPINISSKDLSYPLINENFKPIII
jgi:dTDP-4-dehydrorhamnose 3,5-epimerase